MGQSQRKDHKFTIVIDAGHGGHDPGCHGTKHKEKDVALAIALKLGNYIENNCPDVKVVYTRKTDIFLELNERAKIANDNNADLFLCIHCNASPKKEVFGSETYAMGLHKSKGNLEVAKRENAAILLEDNYKKNYDNFDPNSDEANIIFSIYQNLFLEKSLNLASKIQEYYGKKACRHDKGVKQAGFLVLWKTSMPSLLTETGFLTNPKEEKFLGSKEGQDYMALSMFLAFRKYKDELNAIKKNYEDELEKRVGCDANAPIYNEHEIKHENKDTALSLHIDTAININSEQKTDEVEPKKYLGSENKSEEEVFYSIQILNSQVKLKSTDAKFKKLKDIVEYKAKNNQFKYSTGKFVDFQEATKEQNRIRELGFKDAFIVGFKGKNRISVKEVKEILDSKKEETSIN
jgi:N-acetylmuramoyl-L-alanine amidase